MRAIAQRFKSGSTYAPTPQQIDFQIQVALSDIHGLWLWHSDVANDFAEAMEPKQTYYMRIDEVFHEWYSTLSLVFVIF